jgi:hypothetical protein
VARENPASADVLFLWNDPTSRSAGDFAGAQRLSVGFMQTVMELLLVPRDIVLNWRVGEGTSFLAGENSN